MSFADAVVLVTGAGSGIGRGVALELARRGAVVFCADIDADTAEATATQARVAGGRATAARLDVGDRQAYADLVERIVGSNGRLDYLFNNAGIGVGGEGGANAPQHWGRGVDGNVWGGVHRGAIVDTRIAPRGSGHIVNTASVAGLVPFTTMTPYSMTKHAVVGLSLSLRAEAAALGVKVSALCPAFIETGIFAASHIPRTDKDAAVKSLLLFKPMPLEAAVRKILRGVERNRALIVFPFYAHVLWWMQRVNASALQPLMRGLMARLRALRS
jgi:NAD(P)-dependent dehydrogenase (short-subunit alcohol dehydrogenase family)